jgi:DNA-binding response OmpR family regulator
MKLLIVEGEEELRNSLVIFFKSEGYICETSSSFKEGLEKINVYKYDCIITDIGLKDGSGLDIVRALKDKRINCGAIIISGKSTLEDKIEGLEIGADDYLTKPFHLSELNARLKSLLRRRKFDGEQSIIFNEIKIAPDTLRVAANGKALTLTKKEYDLLTYFISNKTKILTKETIVEHLWGDHISSSDSFDFLYTHVSNLRKKLIDHGVKDYINTVYKIGYRFSEE